MWYKALSMGDGGFGFGLKWECERLSVSGYAIRWTLHEIRNTRCSMEMAELKGLINDLEARMTKIRDWL